MIPRRLVKYVLYFQGRKRNVITRGGSVCVCVRVRVCTWRGANCTKVLSSPNLQVINKWHWQTKWDLWSKWRTICSLIIFFVSLALFSCEFTFNKNASRSDFLKEKSDEISLFFLSFFLPNAYTASEYRFCLQNDLYPYLHTIAS